MKKNTDGPGSEIDGGYIKGRLANERVGEGRKKVDAK